MSKFTDALQNLVDKIDLAINDFTTLDVVTLSGKISLALNGEKFMKPVELIKKAEASTEISVEAFTHIDFDQDVIQFYKDGLTENDLTYQLHQQAVESSKTARIAMLNFVKEAVAR
jgi:hypothetical protein